MGGSLPLHPYAMQVNVVLVEDFGPFRRLLAAEIAHKAPTAQVVGEAANGEAGVEVVSALEPDVVVMDFRLPGIDGGEATRLILARQPQVKVIGFVGEPKDADDLLAAGATEVFFKVDIDDLVAYLGELSGA
jgi:NarL family two-component system response regulator LiaR